MRKYPLTNLKNINLKNISLSSSKKNNPRKNIQSWNPTPFQKTKNSNPTICIYFFKTKQVSAWKKSFNLINQ
jgi:hypothetical protein